MTDPKAFQTATEQAIEAERVYCVCGYSVLPQNWDNHLLSQQNKGVHRRTEAERVERGPLDEEGVIRFLLDRGVIDVEQAGDEFYALLRRRLNKAEALPLYDAFMESLERFAEDGITNG